MPAPIPATAAELREVLGAEYGEYVAAQPIVIDGALAFNTGDPVPVSHVERQVVDADQVKKINTAGGRRVIADSKES